MPIGFVYILQCSNGTLYTGSTVNLDRRLEEHANGKGANHTRKYPPRKLLYVEEYARIDVAFNREKQIQRWSHGKKIALIENRLDDLKHLAECMNATHYLDRKISTEEE